LSGTVTLVYNGSFSQATITNMNITANSVGVGTIMNVSNNGGFSLAVANLGNNQIQFSAGGNNPYQVAYIIKL